MTTPDNNTVVDKVTKWIPDRKAVAGGLAGVVAFFVMTAIPDLDPEVVTGLVAGIMGVVFYITPPSKVDLIRRADDTLKALGDQHGGEVTLVVEPKKDDSV
jgi:hypothetical protein